jgi:ankyrin repeat protein
MIATLLVPLLFCLPDQGERAKADEAFREALVAAIHQFAEEGELDHLRAVLNRHPEIVNLKRTFHAVRKPYWTDEYTALHRAAERGREDVVAYLIDKWADVNAAGPLDWTPLHVAAQKGDLAVVKRLVKAGAKVGAKTVAIPERFGLPPGSGRGDRPRKIPAIPSLTPLELAQEAKHAEVVKYLKAAR